MAEHPGDQAASALEELAFLYMPSLDVAQDLEFYGVRLGPEIVFAIEAFGARVAQVRLSEHEPHLLLADHLEREAPVLVFRVDDLEADAQLAARRRCRGRRPLRDPPRPLRGAARTRRRAASGVRGDAPRHRRPARRQARLRTGSAGRLAPSSASFDYPDAGPVNRLFPSLRNYERDWVRGDVVAGLNRSGQCSCRRRWLTRR